MKPKYLEIQLFIDRDDEVPADFPFKEGNWWNAKIDLDTKKILNWPEQEENKNLYEKVVDRGSYYLLNIDKNIISSKEHDYVPECVPNLGDDYINLDISADGIITNWISSLDDIISEFDND